LATVPLRDLGPSSTCFPTFTWAWQGSTTGSFGVGNLGHALTPPASSDAPSLGVGSWVETKVDLSEFRGRRAHLRYLVASLKATAETHVAQFGNDRDDDYTLGSCSVSAAGSAERCLQQFDGTGELSGHPGQFGDSGDRFCPVAWARCLDR